MRQFQTDAGLEASGDAGLETCRALFTDVETLMAEASALRPGDPGAEEMCRGLKELGYAAHDDFDMQTELALMQFQRANGMNVTGIADAATLSRLEEPNAVGVAGYLASGAEAALEEKFTARIVRHASRLLGRVSNFDDAFGLVQYVYLKCGVAVLDRAQFAPAGAELSEAAPGDVMVLELDGGELCGVTTYDGAIIYRAEDGRILKCYPASMDVEDVQLYRLVIQ